MIPKTFKLGGVTWKIIIEDEIKTLKGEALFGLSEGDSAEIRLAKTVDKKSIPKDVKGQTYYHELVHAILTTMDHPLNSNEQFVQTFATFLHQYEVTKK